MQPSTVSTRGPLVKDSIAGSAARASAVIAAMLFFSMIPVTMLVAPLKELVARRFDSSAFWTHSFMSVNMIGAIVIAPLVNLRLRGDDRRKRIALLALSCDALLLAAMGIAPSLPLLLTLRFFEGAAHIIAISSLMAVAAGWAAAERRGRIMGLVGAAMMFGTAVGTRIGGVVWLHLPGWTFQTAGGVSAATALACMLLVRESPNAAQHRGESAGPISALMAHRALGIPYAFALIERLCVGVIVSTFVLYLSSVLNLSPDQRSRLLLTFLLPFALLVYPAGRLVDRIGRVWPIFLASISFGVLFATYGMWATHALYPVMLTSGVISAIMFAPTLALTADLAPPGGRAAAFTGMNVAGSMGFTIGPLLGGSLFALTGGDPSAARTYAIAFAITGLIQACCAVVTLPALLALRRRGATR